MAKGWLIALIVIAVVGIALVSVGAGLIPFFNNKIKTSVNDNVLLINNSEAYKAWASPPAPIYLDFHFFDVLNPDDIVTKASRPHVVERGPYVYRELKDKIDIEFHANNTRIYFKEAKYYVFDAELSNGTEDDEITFLNIALVTIGTHLEYYPSIIQTSIRLILGAMHAKLFVTHTVRELLWGYTPDVIKILRRHIPLVVPNITVGIYTNATANGTNNGKLEISTGVADVKDLGVINSWNDAKNVSFWTTPTCNMINGTEGMLWHPFIERTERLYIFNTDLCRSLYIDYESDTKVSSSNIPTYRFVAPPSLMANVSVNPDNAGFCTPSNHCMGAGVLNVSNCRAGTPIIMSLPHFLDAAEEYQSAIDGMHPNNKTHQTFVDVEPTTGVVINGAKKLQVNFYVKKLHSLAPTLHLLEPHYVFPILWVTERAKISDDDAAKFKKHVLQPILTAQIVQYGLIGLGALMILIVLVFVLIIMLRQRRGEIVLDDRDDPLISDA